MSHSAPSDVLLAIILIRVALKFSTRPSVCGWMVARRVNLLPTQDFANLLDQVG